jgi:hypothetical protein
MWIVLGILFIIVVCFIVAFFEQSHKIKKLTGKSLWWWWTHGGKE